MIPYPVIMGQSQTLLFKPDELSNYIPVLKQSNFNSIQLDGFTINSLGDITYYEHDFDETRVNSAQTLNISVIVDGMYTYSSRIPALLLAMVSNTSTIGSVNATFYNLSKNINSIYETICPNPTNSSYDVNQAFVNPPSSLQRNFIAFKNTFPSINTINLDITDWNLGITADENALIAFVILLNKLGYGVTFSFSNNANATPEQFASFLVSLLQTINTEITNAQLNTPNIPVVKGLSLNVVRGLILPTYGNFKHQVFSDWTDAINNKDFDILNFTFNTSGFILLAFQTTNNNNQLYLWETVNGLANKGIIGGAVLAHIDGVLENLNSNAPSLINSVNALCMGLNEVNVTLAGTNNATITYMPVDGESVNLINSSSFAFSSPVFTLVFNGTGTLADNMPIPLQVTFPSQGNSNLVFSIFPRPASILNPSSGWAPAVNGKNEVIPNTFSWQDSQATYYTFHIELVPSNLGIFPPPPPFLTITNIP